MLVLGAGLVASAALAEGGGSVGSAPVVKFGVWEKGTTVNGFKSEESSCHVTCPIHGISQYWKIKLKTGDDLTINWQIAASNLAKLRLLPVGTNSYTVESAKVLAEDKMGSSLKSQLRYKAPKTGTYVLVVLSNDSQGVAYGFAARVKHRAAR
jgi:hypothetical protein